MNEYNEIDKQTGKHYKTIGNIRVFEPEYNLSFGMNIPKSKLKQYNSAFEEAKKIKKNRI